MEYAKRGHGFPAIKRAGDLSLAGMDLRALLRGRDGIRAGLYYPK